MSEQTTIIEVDPANVYSMNWSAGELQVRAFPVEMPESGTLVSFVGRDWIVARRNVPTVGGRNCYVAYLTSPP